MGEEIRETFKKIEFEDSDNIKVEYQTVHSRSIKGDEGDEVEIAVIFLVGVRVGVVEGVREGGSDGDLLGNFTVGLERVVGEIVGLCIGNELG